MNRGTVLLVDDDRRFADDLSASLVARGHTVAQAYCADEARRQFDECAPHVVFLDLQLPDGNGLELLADLQQRDPECTFAILSGHGSVGSAVEAIKLGAVDFVEKPVRIARVEAIVVRALESRTLRRNVEQLRQDVVALRGTESILGRSPAIRETVRRIERVAAAPDTTVLLTGESGTGKELAARAVHDASPRAAGPFIAVNCAALTGTLLESELFGYVDGAFTGGQPGGRSGLFEAADGGTLFLDEISELELALQAKLLRVLQERRVRRVGGVNDRAVDIRVIASTNRELATEVAERRFRQDLFFRLQVASVELPPLRDRKDDALLLADHYVHHFARQMGKHVDSISAAARSALRHHDWPGNVRELRNVIEYAVILCVGEEIAAEHLNLHGSNGAARRGTSPKAVVRSLPDRRLATLEKVAISAILDETNGNVSAAARELGIHRQTLYNKLKSHGLR